MSKQPILPEAITDPEAFEQGYIYGEQAATNDLAASRSTSDEALDGMVEHLQGVREEESDWYAGMCCGYRVTRSLS